MLIKIIWGINSDDDTKIYNVPENISKKEHNKLYVIH